MKTKLLVALLGCVLLISNAHAESPVEDEIARTISDPCKSKLEYLEVGGERALSCKGCSLLKIFDPYDDWDQWEKENEISARRLFGAIEQSSERDRWIFFQMLDAAYAKANSISHGYGPVFFSGLARTMGLCY